MDSPYKKLAFMLLVNAVLMFILTYSLIAAFDHFYPNINRMYMSLIMVSSMAIVMFAQMRSMYPDKKLNMVLYAVFTVVFAGTFFLARNQAGVGNEAFLQSMIPHHSSAILMCERSAISDPEIIRLCGQIVRSQEQEISQMKKILERY